MKKKDKGKQEIQERILLQRTTNNLDSDYLTLKALELFQSNIKKTK
jgi:hypothetical protein